MASMTTKSKKKVINRTACFILLTVAVLLFFTSRSTSWPVGDHVHELSQSTWRLHPTDNIGSSSIPAAVMAFSPIITTTARSRARILNKHNLLIRSAPPVTSFGLSLVLHGSSSSSSVASDTTSSSSSSSSSSSTLIPVDNNEDKETSIQDEFFFIRPALMVDIGKASQILTDGFFTLTPMNFLGYFYERLLTYLSLEATCSIIERSNKVTSVFENLNQINNNNNNNNDNVQLSGPRRLQLQLQQGPMKRKLFVACQKETGVVLGMVEVDARAQREPSSLPNIIRNVETNQILPYMCNLAIDRKYQRRGIAKSLVRHCEEQVLQWYDEQQQQQQQQPPPQLQDEDESDGGTSTTNIAMPASLSSSSMTTTTTTSIENSLSLKVRMTNDAAISLYENLGYDRIQQQTDPKTNEVLLLMKKQLLKRKIIK